jgi:uncharacterized protein YciI
MKFVVLFEDNPAAGADVRTARMAEHLAFLEGNANRIEAAGPLRTADGQGAGGLWVVEAGDASEIDRLVKADPFWMTGLRKSVRILRWAQVYADGRRLIVP